MDDTLRTKRLILRRVRETDFEDMHAIFTDPRAMQYWSTMPHQTEAETRDWIAATIAGHPHQADDFVLDYEGRVIGKAGMWEEPEIGFILHPDYWRQGLAREAIEAVIGHLFTTRGLKHITADVDPRNAASITLLTSLGFQETGRAVRTVKLGDEWCDSVYFALEHPA